MLGKEDVLLWFKDLESYKRIDVMYDLLNMCIPFEIRFLGSCIEEIGKHTYQELRGPSIVANDVDRLSKDASLQSGGLADAASRQRAVIYMSVLTARNCSCANWYYRTLFQLADPIETVLKVTTKEESSKVLSELLLLYTIGLYHPAFTFEQKTYFNKALNNLLVYYDDINGKSVQVHEKPNANTNLNSLRIASQEVQAMPVAVPVKPPLVMPGGDALPVQHLQGLPVTPNLLLARSPMFPPTATVVGPPEVRPFTGQTQSNTSLVSQAASPPQSRALSPHQSIRPLPPTGLGQTPILPAPTQMIHGIETVPVPQSLHLDSLISPPPGPLPFAAVSSDSALKANEQENNFISEDKQQWNEPLKKPNGLRGPPKNYYPLANLKIDPDKPPLVHCSNSTSSSSSSRNQSPTDTPSATPAVTPHGPGRGPMLPPPQPPLQQSQLPPQSHDAKARVNGLPPPPPAYIAPCDQPPFSTVPSYTTFQPQPRYYPPIRHPFQNSFALPASDMIYNYPSFYYSSVTHPLRSCRNCGALGHTGVECNAQSVEDITQAHYILDYESPTQPENPPEK